MRDSLSRLLCLTLGLLLPALAQQNVVLQSTDPDIIYNPPLCTASSIMTGCVSPWQVFNDSISPSTIVYTNGPIQQSGNVTPQMFLNFRASALYLRCSSSSNATVNFTLTAEPSDITITKHVNTSISLIVAVNVPETQTTTLSVTFLQEDAPTRFDIESITLTVSNASATSSFLPSPSLPMPKSPSTIVSPSPTSTATSSGMRSKTTIIVAALAATGALLL